MSDPVCSCCHAASSVADTPFCVACLPLMRQAADALLAAWLELARESVLTATPRGYPAA
jgi:hypothetical protein